MRAPGRLSEVVMCPHDEGCPQARGLVDPSAGRTYLRRGSVNRRPVPRQPALLTISA